MLKIDKEFIMNMKSLIFGITLFVSAASIADLNSLPNCTNLNEQSKLEVGYSCKAVTKATKNFESAGEVKWTLVSKTTKGPIWAAETPRWGNVFLGYREDEKYQFLQAIEVCDKTEEVVVDGRMRSVQMTLPKIGFGKKWFDSRNDPLSFEALLHLNYSVVSFDNKGWFWSISPAYFNHFSWAFSGNTGKAADMEPDYRVSVRCIGLSPID